MATPELTPLQVFAYWSKTKPDAVYLRQPIGGKYRTFTWAQAFDEVARMATHIRGLNLPLKSQIAILSKNCAHWLMADFAIWMSGHVSVPLYANLTEKTIRQILDHSESRLLFIGKLDNWDGVKNGIPKNLPMVMFPYEPRENATDWDKIIQNNKPLMDPAQPKLGDRATIIYTSGTTGVAKGVIHSFNSFSYVAPRMISIAGIKENDRFFSYLPLAHVAERILTETLALYAGAEVSFVESLQTFAENLKETRPTVFLAVPRIWQKFQDGVLTKMPKIKLDRILRIPILNRLIRHKIKKALGLEKCHFAITGAAPIPSSLIVWYMKLGLHVQEVYGMTENFVFSHFTQKKRLRLGYVGQALEEVTCKLSAENEILMHNKCLMEGYFKEPTLTGQIIKDGFLHTGDQGEISNDGYLKITGRVKDLFKTAKGKYVAPGPIERSLSQSGLFEQVCVTGISLPQPVALVRLSELARQMNKETLRTLLTELIAKTNSDLDPHEQIDRLIIVQDEWTVENDVLTPTMKIKRNAVDTKYEGLLASMSKLSPKVLWQSETH